MRLIDTVILHLTTFCNMACPDCCSDIPARDKDTKSFYSWEYFVDAARWFHGIERLHLSGGEPSMHPQFGKIAAEFKELFQCGILTVETNGTLLRRKVEAFTHFDRIYITHYTKDTFAGSPDNTKEIEFARANLACEISVCEVTPHVPRSTRNGSRMCDRGTSGTVAYVDGSIYPCCVGSGLATKVCILPSADWMNAIQTVHPPCGECFFALPDLQ